MTTAQLIDGRFIANTRRQAQILTVQRIIKLTGRVPSLHVLLIGNNLASHVYVNNKKKACAAVGIKCKVHYFAEKVNAAAVKLLINNLNQDDLVNGILLQMPLPAGWVAADLISEIAPDKDVDGLHPHNLGKLLVGKPNLIPCTPQGCLALIKHCLSLKSELQSQGENCLQGKLAVVVGRSILVGKPMAALLINANATVIVANSTTRGLAQICKQADILVTAIGSPNFFTNDFIKPGAIVIDVGINRLVDDKSDDKGVTKLVGDVDQTTALKLAGFLSPVPGGVGPMTVSYLLSNTIQATVAQTKDLQL